MGTGDAAQIGGSTQPGEGHELTDIDFVGAAGFGVGDVGEPFELGRHLGQGTELYRGQRIAAACGSDPNQIFCRLIRHCSAPAFQDHPTPTILT